MQKDKKEIQTYDLDEYEDYIQTKKAQVPLFGGLHRVDLNDEETINYLLSEDFFDHFVDAVAYNSFLGYMGEEVKNNAYDINAFLRENKPYQTRSEKEEHIANYGEIIQVLNSSVTVNSLVFYKKQYLNRVLIKRNNFNKFLLNDDFVKEIIPDLNASIASDYDAINAIYEADRDTFFEEVVPDNLLQHNFLNTLNVLFDEFPELYSNKAFLERALYILQNNKLLIKGKESIYEVTDEDCVDKNMLYRTKKLIKRLNKLSR